MARLFLTRWLISRASRSCRARAARSRLSVRWRSMAPPSRLAKPCMKAMSASANMPSRVSSTSSTPKAPSRFSISTLIARRMPCSAMSCGVRNRVSSARWLEITGRPVLRAKPAGEARSAPIRAFPITSGPQPTPARTSRVSAPR